MDVRQIVYEGVGGLKLAEVDSNGNVASLKYDGSQYHLHIKNGRAYALTSKRESVKTGMYNDRFENFDGFRDEKFSFKRETIIVCEASAEHLYLDFQAGQYLTKSGERVPWARRSNFVGGIMNSNMDTIMRNYGADGNPLKLIAFSVLYWEGKDVRHLSFQEKFKMLKNHFPSAGQYGEKVNSKLLYRIQPIRISDMLLTDNDMLEEGFIRNDEFRMEGYVVNERASNRSFKIKRIQEADCIVMGYDWDSTGKYKENGWIKSIIVGCFISKTGRTLRDMATRNQNKLRKFEVNKFFEDGVLVEVGKISGFPESLRDNISNNPNKYIGLPVECEFHEWTGKKMRHPRISDKGFRTDKLIKRCTIDQMG